MRHQAEVLKDHALLDHDHGVQDGLEPLDGERAARFGIVVEVAALALREPPEARGPEIRTVVDHEDAHRLVQELEEPVEVHERVLVHGDEVGGAGPVHVPLVHVEVLGTSRGGGASP